MRKVVFLGDSILNYAQGRDWTKRVADALNLKFRNFAVSAGNNVLQCMLMEKYILSDDYDESDIFVWEINDIGREATLIRKDQEEVIIANSDRGEYNTFLYELENVFEKSKLFLRCHYNKETIKFRDKHDPFSSQSDPTLTLQRVLANIKMLSKTNKVYVCLGWRSCIQDDKIIKIFNDLINSTNAHYIDEPILDWCVINKLELDDDMHPENQSSYEWASKNLIPLIDKYLRNE